MSTKKPRGKSAVESPFPSPSERVGYARVSTDMQTTALQLQALQAAGCAAIFEETASGARSDRPQLVAAIKALQAGDVLTVWRLDRLGRSLADLLAIAAEVDKRGAHLASLTEHLDSSTAGGRLIFHVFGAVAQFERDLMAERTSAGMRAAAARGIKLGRPRALTPQTIRRAVAMLDADPGLSIPELAQSLRVGATTLRVAVSDFRRRRGDAPPIGGRWA